MRRRGAIVVVPVLLAALLLCPGQSAGQTNGVWGSMAPTGIWSSAINWQSGNVADGTGATADFSQLTMTNNVLVHLDAVHTVGNLVFGDIGNTYNWTLDNNGTQGNVLTLATSNGAQPSIAVNNGSATISAVLAGTEGLVVNPQGQSGTLYLTGLNTIYDTASESQNSGAIQILGGTLSIAADEAPGTRFMGIPGTLGYLPPGNGGAIVSGASETPGSIEINGGALQTTQSFVLSPFRGIEVGSPSGGGGGTINVLSGTTLTYGMDSAITTETIFGWIEDTNLGGSLTLTGGGTLLLNSNNTYTGGTNINGSGFTLQAGTTNILSRFSPVSVASGATFLLNGYSQSVGSLAGAGSVTNNTSSGAVVTLTIGSDNTSPTFSGVLSNTNNGSSDIISLLTKVGTGNQTFSTSTGGMWTSATGGGYDLAGPTSGAAVVAVVGGTLTLDLSHAATQTNLINPYYALQLGGGTLALNEAASSISSSQTFSSTTVNTGGSAVVVTTNGNTSPTGFILGNITRNTGGTVDFTPGSATTGNINTSNSPTSFLGGWATFGGGTTWAGVNGSNNIMSLTSAGGSYTSDAWSGGSNTNVTQNDSISGQTTNSLRFNAAGPTSGGFSVTLSGDNTISSGGILVTSAAGANGATIAGGGTLTSGNSSDLIVNQFDAAGSLTISALIIDSPFTGSIGLTKSGPGTLILSGASTYTGGTMVNAGTLSISSDGNLGSTSGGLTLNGGVLLATGPLASSFTLNADRGIALGPISGVGAGTFNVAAGVTMSVAGIIADNGASSSSLIKTGPGTLVLTGTNTYTGGTYINQGVVVAQNAQYSSFGDYGQNIYFTGNGVLRYGNQGGFYVGQDATIVAQPGVNVIIDNNTSANGLINQGGGEIDGAIVGQGGFTYFSSFGSTSVTANFNQSSLAVYAINYGGPYPALNWTYTGPTTIYDGSLFIWWSSDNGNAPAQRLDPNNVLNLGGALAFKGGGSGPGGPTFGGLTLATSVHLIADTSSQIINSDLSNNTVTFLNSASSNGIVRGSGSTLEIDPSTLIYVAIGSVPNTNGIIGGWATAGTTLTQPNQASASIPGTDWASVNTATGAIVQLGATGSGGSYTSDAWASGNNTTVTQNDDFSPIGANTPNLTTNTLRFVSLTTSSGATLNQTVTLAGTNVIQSGGILVTTNRSIFYMTINTLSGPQQTVTTASGTDNSTFTITGGSLTSGNGTDLIVNQFNPLTNSSLTIASQIVNNGATPIGLTLSGGLDTPGGTLILANSTNSYTGATVIGAATTLLAGAANVIPSASAVVISDVGTLNMNGFNQSIGSLANYSGNLSTLSGLDFGYGTTVTAGTAFASGSHVIILTVGSDNSNTTFNGALLDGNANNLLALAKVGSGTLTLGNWDDDVSLNGGVPNLTNYSGGTVITAGILDILYDADLGAVPASPATNITFNGNVVTPTPPTLQFNSAYMGTSLSANRGITINASDVGYVDTNGNPLITYAGLITVGAGGTFGKAGAGVFELDAPPNLGNNSAVNVAGGTLRLNYGSGATIGSGVTASVSSGATLELAGSISQLNQTINISNAGTLLDSSTTVNQNVGTVLGTGNTVVNAGSSLTAYQIRQNSLTINGNGKVFLSPSGTGSTTHPLNPNNINYSSMVTSLSIGGTMNAWTGTLDIGNNGLVIAYGSSADPYSTIDNMIESGYNGGIWGGTGITSSLAAATIHLATPLNIGLSDFTPGLHGDATFIYFEGQTITTNAILVRLTYMDDLVLAGDMAQSNATSDALAFAANYGSGTTWSVGDLTHDGKIDSNDALAFAANYGIGFPSLDGTTGGEVSLVGSTAAVPEPASVALMLGAMGLGLLAQWRRWR